MFSQKGKIFRKHLYQNNLNRDLNTENISPLSNGIYQKDGNIVFDKSVEKNDMNTKNEELFVFHDKNFLLIDPKDKADEIMKRCKINENLEFKMFLVKLIEEWKNLKIENNSLLEVRKELNNEILNYQSQVYILNHELKLFNHQGNINQINIEEKKEALNLPKANIKKEDLNHQFSGKNQLNFFTNKIHQNATPKRDLNVQQKVIHKANIIVENYQEKVHPNNNLIHLQHFIQANIEKENNSNISYNEYHAIKFQFNEYNSLNRHELDPHPQFIRSPHNIPIEEKIEIGLRKNDIERILNKDKLIPLELSESIICNICFGNFDRKRDYRKLKCNHWYHYECISRWLETKPKCPICKCHA